MFNKIIKNNLFHKSFYIAYGLGFTYTFIDDTIDKNSMPIIDRILTSHVIGSMTMLYPITGPYYIYHQNNY